MVVIGGGLTGCTTAYALAKAGLDVMLLEADTLVSGATSRSMGLVVPAADQGFSLVSRSAGPRAAKVAFAAARQGARELTRLLTRLRVKCDLAGTDVLVNAPFTNDAALLKKEVEARKKAKLDGTWIAGPASSKLLATETQAAMRLRDAGTLDPVAAALGLAQAAAKQGVRVFEHTRVKKTTFTRKTVTVVVPGATITATGVVVATGEPGRLFHQLERHVRTTRGYVVATEPLPPAMRKAVGPRSAIYTEFTESPRWIRWMADGRAVCGGLTGPGVDGALRRKAVMQRSNQLMYELSLRYPDISGLPPASGWDIPVITTADGLPWIGLHRNYPFHFFAMAFGWHGEAWAQVAADAAVRHFTGKATKDDALLGFARAL